MRSQSYSVSKLFRSSFLSFFGFNSHPMRETARLIVKKNSQQRLKEAVDQTNRSFVEAFELRRNTIDKDDLCLIDE